VRIEVGFETVGCGPDQCPVTVSWHATSVMPDLPFELGAPGVSITIIDPIDIWIPVDATAARTLVAQRADNVVDHTSARLEASWVADSCITLDLDGTLTQQPDEADPDLAELYPIAFTVRALRDCLAACPTAGDVLLSYANGFVLAWSYTGAQSVIVRGPGIEDESPIPCN
jgi:hypothetical protein